MRFSHHAGPSGEAIQGRAFISQKVFIKSFCNTFCEISLEPIGQCWKLLTDTGPGCPEKKMKMTLESPPGERCVALRAAKENLLN